MKKILNIATSVMDKVKTQKSTPASPHKVCDEKINEMHVEKFCDFQKLQLQVGQILAKLWVSDSINIEHISRVMRDHVTLE